MEQTRSDGAMRIYEQRLGAWNRRDADGFAAVFAADASVIG